MYIIYIYIHTYIHMTYVYVYIYIYTHIWEAVRHREHDRAGGQGDRRGHDQTALGQLEE